MKPLILSFVLSTFFSPLLMAADYYSAVASASWNAAASWSSTEGGVGGAGVPAAGDNVFILEGHTINISAITDNGGGGTTPNSITGTTFSGSATSMFYMTGDITVYFGGTLNITAPFMTSGDLYVNGDLTSNDYVVLLGESFLLPSGSLSSDDLVIAGTTSHLMVDCDVTVQNSFHLDGTDALLCGGGHVDVNNGGGSGTLILTNSATVSQICLEFVLLNCDGGCATVIGESIDFHLLPFGRTALFFDGTNDYVDFGSSTVSGTYHTVEFWFYAGADIDGSGTVRDIIGLDGAGGIGVNNVTGNITGETVSIFDASRSNVSSITSTVVAGWNHVAFVSDGSNYLTAYLNGSDETVSTFGAGAPVFANSSDLSFGETLGNGYFDGALDEVRLWSTQKTESNVHDQMFIRLDGSESGLLGFWRFDSGSGSQLIDETSNNNHGTLTNFNLATAWVPSGAPIGNGLLDGSTHVDVRATWAVPAAVATSRSGWHSHGNSGGTYINLNYSTFGHNNVAGNSVLSTDLPAGVEARYGRVWHVYRHGNPHANVLIDVQSLTGSAVALGTDSDYVLLYRAGTSGPFSVYTGSASISGQEITISGVILSTGYFTIGTRDATNSPLPVDMSDFYGVVVEGGVQLYWETKSELDNDFFIVERSMDQKNWFDIGRAEGNGTTNQTKNYSYLDRKAKTDNYYRLKQVDYDGDYEYSEIIRVRKTSMNISYVYPNPVRQEFNLEGIDRSELRRLYLIKMNGEEVELSTSSRHLPSSLSEGVYILRAILSDGAKDFRVVKR